MPVAAATRPFALPNGDAADRGRRFGRRASHVILAAVALLSGCAGQQPMAMLDTPSGPVEIARAAAGAPIRVSAGAEKTDLAHFRSASLQAFWMVQGIPVLVIAGTTDRCRHALTLLAVEKPDIARYDLAPCPERVALSASDDALVATGGTDEPLRWIFRDGVLTGPVPLPEAAAGPRPAGHRRRRAVEPVDQQLLPPPVSRKIGPEVIPPSVDPTAPRPPTLRLD